MGEVSCYFGIGTPAMGYLSVLFIGFDFALELKLLAISFVFLGCLLPVVSGLFAERYGHLRTRSIIGLIGLIIFTFLQKLTFLMNDYAADRRLDLTPVWVGSPGIQFFTISVFASFFHSLFAFEAGMKELLPYGQYPTFVTVMCLLTAISTGTEAWLLNFEKERILSPALNTSLGACFLDLYIVLKTDF